MSIVGRVSNMSGEQMYDRDGFAMPALPRHQQNKIANPGVPGEHPVSATPIETKRSLTCTVCNGDSGNYYLNYGAAACFSCRAFFRRIVQGQTMHRLKCKKMSEFLCEINSKGSKCRKCRYQRCLQQGMRSDKVLNEDQKEFRFRRSIKKKGKIKVSHTFGMEKRKKDDQDDEESIFDSRTTLRSTFHSPATNQEKEGSKGKVEEDITSGMEPMEDDHPDEEGYQATSNFIQMSANQQFAILYKSDQQQPVLEYVILKDRRSTMIQSKRSNRLLKEKFRKMMYKYSNCLKSGWQMALYCMTTNPTLIENLILFHQRKVNHLSKSLLKHHFVTIAKVFTDFALSQDFFRRLCQDEQKRLLVQNSATFIQYIISNCFRSQTGLDQISSWLCLDTPPKSILQLEETLAYLPLPVYNTSVSLFAYREDLQHFNYLMLGCNGISSIPMTFIHYMAKLCLAQSSPETCLEERDIIEDAREEHLLHIEWANTVFGIPSKEEFLHHLSELKEMTRFFHRSASWRHGADTTVSKIVELSMTANKDNWLGDQLKLFEPAYQLLPMSQAHIKAAARIDYPPFVGDMKYDVSLWKERYLRILKSSNDVEMRSLAPQANYLSAFVLSQVKIENCSDLMEQLNFISGTDSAEFEFLGPRELLKDKYCLKQVVKHNPKALPYQTTISKLSFNLDSLLKDPNCFKMMALICMCDTEEPTLMRQILLHHFNKMLRSLDLDDQKFCITNVLRTLDQVKSMGQSLARRLQ